MRRPTRTQTIVDLRRHTRTRTTVDLRWILILEHAQLGELSKRLVLTADPDAMMLVVVTVPDARADAPH
jgi:hypothetical protein